MSERKRVGIVGMGSVGTALAGFLADGGHDVHVAARSYAVETLNTRGVAVSGALGSVRGRVKARTRLTGRFDVVFLCTKAQDTESAVQDNRDALDTLVVVVQNGLGGLDTVRSLVPHAHTVGGLTLFASTMTEPGIAVVTGPGTTYLGTDRPDDRAGLDTVARVIDKAFPIEIVENFPGAQWTKLTINMLNAMPAITGLSMQQSTADPRLLTITTRAMRECVQTGLRLGVHFEALQGLNHRLLSAFAQLPVRAGGTIPLRLTAAMGPVPNPGSTLQSLRRGQKTEIDFLHGAVVRHAQALSAAGHLWQTPTCEFLVELVHRVETTGDFVEPHEVSALFHRRVMP